VIGRDGVRHLGEWIGAQVLAQLVGRLLVDEPVALTDANRDLACSGLHARCLDRVSRALDFSCVWVNTHIPIVAEMPHGGFKHSGYGKDLSMYGLEDYTRIKHVMSYIGE